LADSLLLLSREDARATPLKLEPVQLDELIREMAEHMRPLAQEREVDLQVGPLAAVTVEVDVGCLRQVLFNLLDNAVKYTGPAGSVSVASRVEDNTAVIEVSDTGIGIPTESLPRVFDRFYRVDKSRSRQLGGTGLGLSICKALVERHGGRIEVQSVVDRGSTFRVVLPSSIRSFS
jgi:two-component system phosphate regulon sensor histidine kinase PhoR